MRYTDSRKVALYISFYISAFVGIVFLVLGLMHKGIEMCYLLPFIGILFLFSFFVVRITVEKYIYEKVRVIYKSILSLKTSKGQLPKNASYSLEGVNADVLEWTQKRTKEIDKLRELEAYRREYIGNISHELKTPVFNIQGYVLTLLDGALNDPEINKKYLIRTEKSVERLITILEDLETINMLESAKLNMNISRFDLVELTRDIIDALELKAKTKKAKIYIPEEFNRRIFVLADKDRIHQVLTNLIDNAIKYGPAKKAEVKISFFTMDESLLVEVSDNGPGIAQTDLPRIFERFYRTDKARSRSQGGTGLGLSIVKHIVEAHGQSVHVRSSLNVGTTFGFTLEKAK
jgi:two-component system phosphate regulon sensor histidine kinase PhoR